MYKRLICRTAVKQFNIYYAIANTFGLMLGHLSEITLMYFVIIIIAVKETIRTVYDLNLYIN